MLEVLGEPVIKRILPHAARQMQEAIEETGGREVFFSGTIDGVGRVNTVRVCARGNAGATPAVIEGLGLRDVVLHNHPSGDLGPSEADLDLASVYATHGHGVYIVDNEVQRVYVVVEPFLPKQLQFLDAGALAGMLSPKSRMARALPQFEVRPQQVQMLEAVSHAFNRDGIAVVEAPTGVGKTLAYLLPAAVWAMQNKERVVISTRTINLQEQIVFKDIPLLQRCLDTPFTACLVKGRGNYVCLRKLERALSEATLFDDEQTRTQLEEIVDWAEETEDGSLADLAFVPRRELWEHICSEADTCGMGRCPEQKRCFVTRARRQIAKADLLVVNHHMLFSDVSIKKEAGDFTALAVLPAYRRVIFDEGHSIEDSATEYFGVKASRHGALNTLARLYRIERGKERGLIPAIKLTLVRDCVTLALSDYEVIQTLLEEKLLPAIAVCREAIASAFGAVRALAAAKCGQIGRDIQWRLTETALADPELREIHNTLVMPAVNHIRALTELCSRLLKRMRAIEPTGDQTESPVATEILQLNAYANRMESAANVLAEATSETIQENTVRWIEIDGRNEQVVRLVRCPLHVGKPLAEWVYNKLSTVVITSATLAVQRKFDYLFDRIGLEEADPGRVLSITLDSPFNFKKQAILGVVTDLPNPDERAFLEESTTYIHEALRVTGGHAFVLFTSFFAVDFTYRRLENELRSAGITPLRQGEATRTQLLDRFRADVASVLFATDSFWEGVDVAGEALQCVILPKLPFRVPTEPIQEARAEAITASGGNPFMEYSVPQAVIKFRQGFGRLIRRRSDQGAILVLDRRIITKYYGRAFLNSLPDPRIVRGPRVEVLAALKEFFGDNNGD